MEHFINRRNLLTTTGTVAIASLLAGCTDGDDDEEPIDDTDDTEDAPDDADEPDGEIEIDPDTTVVLDGYSSHWEGIEPDDIAGLENPTLVLEEGGEYEFEWINADGALHNLQLWDEDEALIDDYTTEDIDEEGEGDTLTFTADPEMAIYACEFHPPQRGDLVIE